MFIFFVKVEIHSSSTSYLHEKGKSPKELVKFLYHYFLIRIFLTLSLAHKFCGQNFGVYFSMKNRKPSKKLVKLFYSSLVFLIDIFLDGIPSPQILWKFFWCLWKNRKPPKELVKLFYDCLVFLIIIFLDIIPSPWILWKIFWCLFFHEK